MDQPLGNSSASKYTIHVDCIYQVKVFKCGEDVGSPVVLLSKSEFSRKLDRLCESAEIDEQDRQNHLEKLKRNGSTNINGTSVAPDFWMRS